MGMYYGDRMLFVAVDPIAEAISVCCYGYVLRRQDVICRSRSDCQGYQRVLLWVCIKEIGCFLSQSIR